MSKNLKEIMSYLAIIMGAILASFSVACILLPNDAIDYGTAGIGIIINKLTGYNLSLCVFLTFIPFLLFGRILLGNKFFVKALVGSTIYTIGLSLFEYIPFTLDVEHFIAVAFGGCILGVGLSLILKFGGCIDGSEILANIIVNKLQAKTGKNYSMSTILILFNVVVYLFAFVLIDRNTALLSLMVFIVATMVIDHFTDRYEAIKKVTIITKDSEKIINELREELNKTCTIIETSGAISGSNKTLVCYVNYFELSKIKSIILRNNNTFSTISTIDEVIK